MSEARRPGRPPKALGQRKRATLGLRVRSDLRERMSLAAAEHQRSVSEEAEHRLERTFRDDEVLAELRRLRSPPSDTGLRYVDLTTAEQLRAARAALRFEQADVAIGAGVSVETIKRIEKGSGPISVTDSTRAALSQLFEQSGVRFTAVDDCFGILEVRR